LPLAFGKLKKSSARERLCGECAFFVEKTGYCKKMWVSVTRETASCEHFVPRERAA